MSKENSKSEREIWQAYEAFKNSLPADMNWREREKAIKEYCEKEGI